MIKAVELDPVMLEIQGDVFWFANDEVAETFIYQLEIFINEALGLEPQSSDWVTLEPDDDYTLDAIELHTDGTEAANLLKENYADRKQAQLFRK